tara:strand:+ start:3595 stop:3963 length:369 start_codon:yes stop_codon:yes gene_type:complete
VEELSEQQLTSLTDKLLATKSELETLLATSKELTATVTLDQQAVGRLSRMDAMQQQSMAKAKTQLYEKQYRQVLKALNRIDINDYGYCQTCDESIGFSRLAVRPESDLCIQCQEKAEKHATR